MDITDASIDKVCQVMEHPVLWMMGTSSERRRMRTYIKSVRDQARLDENERCAVVADKYYYEHCDADHYDGEHCGCCVEPVTVAKAIRSLNNGRRNDTTNQL